MMGSSRTNEKGAPAAANPLNEENNDYSAHGLNFLDGNVDENDFDFVPDMALSIAGWEDIHRSIALGIPETIGNPRFYSMNPNPNSFQNPQIDMSSNATNTILQEFPLLPDWNMRWDQQCMNQGHNVISAGDVSTSGGDSNFGNLNRPQGTRGIGGSPSMFHAKDTEHAQLRKNANFNTGQTGFQGKAEGSFLSLGIGGTEEAIPRSQLGSREISSKLKEEVSKIAHARQAMGKTSIQTLDADFMGFHRNNSGFASQSGNVHQLIPTNNDIGVHHTVNSGLGTEEAISRSQLGSREISDKLKEEASTELKIAHVRHAMGQNSVKTLDADFMGFQRNNSGFSSQSSYAHQLTSTNNEIGVHHTVNSGPGSSPHHIFPIQQTDRQHVRNLRSGDLNHYRAAKLKEAASTELKITNSQNSADRTSGQTLDAGFTGFQHNNSGFSNQFSHVDQMTLTNKKVGIHGNLNSEPGSIPSHILQMQQNDMPHGRNIRSGDLDQYRTFTGNQAVHSGTMAGNSTHFLNSQHMNTKPSRVASYTPSGQLQNARCRTANRLPSKSSMNYPSLGVGSSTCQSSAAEQRQLLAQNAMPPQTLGGNLFSERTAAPQVSWVGTGPAGSDAPFPKRLGVEFNGRNSLHTAQRRISPTGTSLQIAGQAYQLPNKGSTRQPTNVLRPSNDRTDGAPVSYPLNSQEPLFALGQSQDALIQLPKDPQRAPPTNASIVDGLSQKSDFHIKPPHKRTAVWPHPASHWVQRQKIIHPTIHHPMPKASIPVTTDLVHTSLPVVSRAQLPGPVAARIRPSVPCISHLRSPVPVTSSPVASHITWKDPDATAKLSGYKCFICKRDLALTSEGPVYQPTVPPPVAILPCGHTFHDLCLQNITPNDQAKDPPCIPCAIGEN